MGICGGCGLAQCIPLPGQPALNAYYATEYRKGGRYGADAADTTAFPRDNLFFFNRGLSVATLLREKGGVPNRPLRVLDVGAGYGHILELIRQTFPGSEVTAHELSEPCVAHLESRGMHVWTGDLEERLAGTSERFDVIVLSHVLEHLRNPVQTLGALRSCLAPGGVIYVEVPHVPSEALRRYFDSPWAPRHDEPHLTFFGAPELRALLGRSALSPVFLDTAGPLYREVSALRFRMPPLMPTLRRLLPASVRKLAATKAGAGLQERDPSFFSYGGHRIWLRSISRST